MTRSPEDMSLGQRLAIGGFAVAMGLVVMAIGGGIIPVDPGSVHAPPWVIQTAGGVFALLGTWIATAGTPVGNALTPIVGPAALFALLSILHWVAFGPGVRKCTGGISVPFLTRYRNVGDLECRFAFGYGALLFDGLILGAILGKWADEHLTGWSQRIAKGTSSTLIVVPLSPFLLILIPFALAQAAWKKVRGGGRTDSKPPSAPGSG